MDVCRHPAREAVQHTHVAVVEVVILVEDEIESPNWHCQKQRDKLDGHIPVLFRQADEALTPTNVALGFSTAIDHCCSPLPPASSTTVVRDMYARSFRRCANEIAKVVIRGPPFLNAQGQLSQTAAPRCVA